MILKTSINDQNNSILQFDDWKLVVENFWFPNLMIGKLDNNFFSVARIELTKKIWLAKEMVNIHLNKQN